MIWLVAAAFTLAALFCLNYGLRSNWRARLAGRSAMLWAVIVAVVLGLSLASRLFGPFPRLVYLLVWLLIIGGLLTQNLTLIRYQRRDRALGTQRQGGRR